MLKAKYGRSVGVEVKECESVWQPHFTRLRVPRAQRHFELVPDRWKQTGCGTLRIIDG